MKIADKSYFTNADKSKLVDGDSQEAAYLVVGKGSQVTDDMATKYGIKGVDQKDATPEPGIVTSSGPDGKSGFVPADKARGAGIVVTDDSGEPIDEPAKPLQGKLPEDFPGRTALEAEDITTYAQLRKAGDVTEVPGIGKATAEKIEAALGESSEAEEEA